MQWIFYQESENEEKTKMKYALATSSLDGYLKVWNPKESFMPMFEHFSSKVMLLVDSCRNGCII